jgi:hypothetical protein
VGPKELPGRQARIGIRFTLDVGPTQSHPSSRPFNHKICASAAVFEILPLLNTYERIGIRTRRRNPGVGFSHAPLGPSGIRIFESKQHKHWGRPAVHGGSDFAAPLPRVRPPLSESERRLRSMASRPALLGTALLQSQEHRRRRRRPTDFTKINRRTRLPHTNPWRSVLFWQWVWAAWGR